MLMVSKNVILNNQILLSESSAEFLANPHLNERAVLIPKLRAPVLVCGTVGSSISEPAFLASASPGINNPKITFHSSLVP